MLQKQITVPVLLAVFLVGAAIVLAQKTDLGILSSGSIDPASISANYPTYRVLTASNRPVKLEAALKAIERKKETAAKAKPKQIQIASQTLRKPSSTPSDIEATIRKYAAEYGANAEVMIVIARCESGFRAEALSPSGAYAGMYQFVSSTWASNRRAMGLDDNPELRFNGEEAIRTAAFKMGRDGYGAWPVCSQKAFSSLALN
jgi:soluble lytic murein transglycosylase-like protein